MVILFSASSSCRRHGRGVFGALQLIRLSFSSSATSFAVANPSSPPPKAHHFIVDFLIDKLGLSTQKAIQASKYLSHLKSIEKPESLVGFLRSHGFSDAQIKKIASCHPQFLRFNVEKTVAPKFQSLKDAGFSESDLVRIFNSNSRLLSVNVNRNLLPRIQFWQGLLGSRDHLIRLLKNNNFLAYSIDKIIMPNLSFLRNKCGVSDERISMMARHSPSFIIQNRQTLVEAADRAEKEMGVARSSGMFLWALWALHCVSKDRLKANLELMKSFGWSEDDFLSAFRKSPVFLSVSQKMLARKMEFLLKEAGCKPLDVARHPVLLMFSLEKRLIPRHRVLKILKAKGLLARVYKLVTVMIYSEKTFMAKFVIPHQKKVPELQEIFMDACGMGAS